MDARIAMTTITTASSKMVILSPSVSRLRMADLW